MSSSKINIIVPNRVQRGKVFLVSVRLDHPMDTGLKRDLMTGKRKPIFFVELLEVFYGGKRVSHMDLTPGISDKPVTSLSVLLGRTVSVEEVKPLVVEAVVDVFGFDGAVASTSLDGSGTAHQLPST